MDNYYNYQPENDYYYGLRIKKKREKKELFYLGMMIGSAILMYVLLQNIFSVALAVFGFEKIYLSDSTVQFAVDTVMTLIIMLVPFSFVGMLISRRMNIHYLCPTNPPKDKKTVILCVFAGLGMCMVGNIATSILSTVAMAGGHEFTMPDINYPQGISGFVLSVIRVALMAAVTEELCFRGTTLQSLRRYGNLFAVLMSAMVFGIMHGNLVQAPFAFIAGIGLGYICVITNSIWPSMIVHFLNNFISVVAVYMLEKEGTNENAVNLLYSLVLYGLIAVGIPCCIILFKKYRYIFSEKSATACTSGQKFLSFISAPAMIIAIIYVVFVTIQYIK